MSRQRQRIDYEPIEAPSHQEINDPAHDDSEFTVYGYAPSRKKNITYHILSIILLGFPYALTFWYPFLHKYRYKLCPLVSAEVLLIYDHFGDCTLVNVKKDLVSFSEGVFIELRYFVYQYTKYVWVPSKGQFDVLEEFIPKRSLETILEDTGGLFESEECNLLNIYGPNEIEVQIKSYWRLFIEEVFNPFYIFQAFSVLLWCFDDYMIYASCVLFLTLVSSITTLIQTRKQSVALHKLAISAISKRVMVLRKQLISEPEVVSVESTDLVPGQILVIPRMGFVMPCDAILLTGSCIVNESMLTGESVPVMKTPPSASDEIYNNKIHKAHTLFSGTHIIQGRYYGTEHILARVTRTGFDTTKGSLVKSIMFPAPVGFKFYKDSLKFVFCLFIVAAVGMGYCLYLYIMREAEIKEIIIRTLDIITIVVPPALPAAMTVGIVYSQNRLRRLGIFCISPPRINICGKIKLACFDKTGTLTHEGLDMNSIVPTVNNNFSEVINDAKQLDVKNPFVQAMATCHSLTRISGELYGDPLDLIMFQHTAWLLEEPGQEDRNYDMLAPTVVKPPPMLFASLKKTVGEVEVPYEIGIIRQFQFSSSLQRMSVIARILGSESMMVFTKGAPERIVSMCSFETIPPDYNDRLTQFTAQGFRVIALAYKELSAKFNWMNAQKVKRDEVEVDLIFLGFVVMQNALKVETTPVITDLQAANVRTVMITGDNAMTAICVARECGMIPLADEVYLLHVSDDNPEINVERIGNASRNNDNIINFTNENYQFAIDGRNWEKLRQHYPAVIPSLLLKTTVFARFKPDHKTQLINSMQSLDYIVSMVGDGANDCGALKAAHVGVSLSQAEASVAAPFTSSIEDISCLISLILEGRCALTTSFAVFKYMALYSLIQFFSVVLLYKNYSTLGDQQFLFIDLIITTTLAITIGRQGPSNQLVAKRPGGSLIAGSNLVPIVLQIVLCGAIQYSALYYLTLQEWYEPNEVSTEEIIVCWENTVIFTVSSFQYVILALVYSKGKPYRKALITNFWLIVSAWALTAFTVYLTVSPGKLVADFFQLIYLDHSNDYWQRLFKDTLLLFPIIHLMISCIIEFFIAESIWLKKVVHFIGRKTQPKNKFKVLLNKNNSHNWFEIGLDRSTLNIPADLSC